MLGHSSSSESVTYSITNSQSESSSLSSAMVEGSTRVPSVRDLVRGLKLKLTLKVLKLEK